MYREKMYRKIWTRKILNSDAFHMCMCFPLSFTTFKSNYFQEQVRTVASADKVLLFFNLQSEWWLQKTVFTISSDLKKAHLQIAETLLQIYLKIGSLRFSWVNNLMNSLSRCFYFCGALKIDAVICSVPCLC